MREAADATPSGMVTILGLERFRSKPSAQARQGEILQSPICSVRTCSSFPHQRGLLAGRRTGP